MADATPLVLAGTSGFSYKGWKGPFYPEDLPQKKWLAYYASQLPAVELNNTFYRMPKESVVAGWAAQVPSHFRFALKASRKITHFKRLKDAGDETGYFLRVSSALGDRLGALLFQLPPNLKCDLDRFDAFLEHLPSGTPAAFEFRHPSWPDAAVLERLTERNFAWVVSDVNDAEAPELTKTASWLYLRLRRTAYDRAALSDWATRVSGARPDRALTFFKHEEAGAGPRLAADFLAIAERVAKRRGPRRARTATPERETG
ncbi:MAG: DUF72 domain-containing protein [Myxococcota bacterium]